MEKEKNSSMNYTERKEYIQTRTDSFVESLNGLYKVYISDKFLKVWLVNSLLDLSFDEDRDPDEEMAYACSISLFESVLEHGCGVSSNGHHRAQKFAKLFQE